MHLRQPASCHLGGDGGVRDFHVAATAAAHGVLAMRGHFSQFQSGDAGHHLSRRVVDTALAPQVTGVVIGDHFLYRPQHELNTIANRLNTMPRRSLNWDTATSRYRQLVATTM